MTLGWLQEEISKSSLPISAGLSNDFKSIILEPFGFIEPLSKKNEIKHFPLEVIIVRFYPWWQEESSPTSWNLSTKFIYTVLNCKGF